MSLHKPVLVFGEILWDLFPDARRIGGASFNFAVHLNRLGVDVLFISAVGNDELGEEALEQATQLGVSTAFIKSVAGQPTGTVEVRLSLDGVPAFDIRTPAAYQAIELSQQELEWIARLKSEWIYHGTLALHSKQNQDSLRRILAASGRRIRRFYDVNLREGFKEPGVVEDLLGGATIVKLNVEEAEWIACQFGLPFRDLEEFTRALSWNYEIPCICVTMGPRGCLIYLTTGAQFSILVRSPGRVVDVVDTVGAGDAFAAGLLYGFLQQWPLLKIADFANCLGALVASKAGAVPQWRWEELKVLLRRSSTIAD